MKYLLLLLSISIVVSGCTREHKHQVAPYNGSKVLIDSSHLKDGVPVFYSFHDGNVTIHFFVLKLKTEIQSYYDACNECYRNKLGYRYEDDKLVCNACNESYSVYHLKDGMGGCYPIKLKGKLNGSVYEIDKENLMKGTKYF